MVMPTSREPLPAPRDGDRTRLRLASGTSWVLDVPVPPLPTTVAVPASCFADNGFPSAVLGLYVEQITRGLADAPEARLRVFGHVAPSADAATDKRRSDALAQSMHAVLVGDEATFTALAEQQSWGASEDQAMLRSLGDNPAAIDGDAGALTALAVRCFQEEWNWGWHHPDGGTSALPLTGELDGATRASLRRAYLLMIAGQVGQDAFIETGSSGCGGYIPVLAADGSVDVAGTAAGRVLVAAYGARRPRAFPCAADDASACRIDDVAASRCRFYRHAVDSGSARVPDMF